MATTMPTAKCLMASGGALMIAMCMLWTRTTSARPQPTCFSTAAAMKRSKTPVRLSCTLLSGISAFNGCFARRIGTS